MPQNGNDFNAIRISLASPDQIRAWSYGEVTKPETINYRTLRPERDGLFCERIFGPTKDWECSCGKYKKIRFKGVKCERCGVEVTRAKVRRERMGRIELAAPVAHIWLSKGIPSRLALLLDLSPRNLERVLYFAQYIITEVNEEARDRALENLENERDRKISGIDEVSSPPENALTVDPEQQPDTLTTEDPSKMERRIAEEKTKISKDYLSQIDELEELRVMKLMVEARYRELTDRFPGVFKAGMGAEAILAILHGQTLDADRDHLLLEMKSTSGQRRKKAVKRLRVVEAFRKSGNLPEWMILSVLPVLPPDLRPMVQLDGGRFATSDLNDLYRRVINRNSRLKRLLELEAPEIIIRNEKRMLQEAVDALIDNGRRGRAIVGSHNHKLKSLSDLLRGKQGRFRQNLLGKRVDYSGRSVIVVGPELQLHQCGLPKRMALELFKPFVMHRLVLSGQSHNIRSAKRAVEQVQPEVWDVLEEVIKDRPVLLNRAPTLHRLGIQAFMPVLIEGSAIQVHPLVCTAFNADFDGDQMAVHVPLSKKAVKEAKNVMLSVYNMLSPASGEPLVAPTLDMVLGCFYLTTENPSSQGTGKQYGSENEANLAKELDHVHLQAPIKVLGNWDGSEVTWINTTVGRLEFRGLLPQELTTDENNWNRIMDKDALKELTSKTYRLLGNLQTETVLDNIKKTGYHYATVSGITIGINDLEVPEKKHEVIAAAEVQIQRLEELFQTGLITQNERYDQTIKIWTDASDTVTKLIEEALPTFGGVYTMAISGAKGNISQIKQMAGMRGLMSDPKGRLIDVPVKASFREGLSVLEYFISTHGARKGLADTALRTADSGYLTRRMIDVAQDVIAQSDDCETQQGIWFHHDQEKERNNIIAPFHERFIGRLAASPIPHPETGEVLIDRNQVVDSDLAKAIWQAGVTSAHIRSPLTCEAKRGICCSCYGLIPATGKMINLGQAAGIIAAQSIGEPGTQLTMRTFHTGGIAGVDITSGIPRVEELLEARIPKSQSILSEIDGIVELEETEEGRYVRVMAIEDRREEYAVGSESQVLVKQGQLVAPGTELATQAAKTTKSKRKKTPDEPEPLVSRVAGTVDLVDGKVVVVWQEQDRREYFAPITAYVLVGTGDQIRSGQQLTAGAKNPHDILRILGKEAVQEYMVEEVQRVYRYQGVTIDDKHIEIIIRQILRKVRIDHSGDTDLLPGEVIDQFIFSELNKKIILTGGDPARATAVLMGITRSSLSTESFLAAASFQETTRVLTEASINGMVDRLTGLKENVIIGRLIPARGDLTEEGRELLGMNEELSLEEPNDSRATEDDDLATSLLLLNSIEQSTEI